MLLLRWRDPVGGAEFWEPPGGGLEAGEGWEAAARRELARRREWWRGAVRARDGGAGLPVGGERRVGPEAFFLAVLVACPPECRLEDDAGAARLRAGCPSSGPALDAVEPPELAGRCQAAAGTTQPAIAMKCAAAAAITSAWKTSWKPNVRGHRFGLRIA